MAKACDKCYLNFRTRMFGTQVYCGNIEEYMKPIDSCAAQVQIGHSENSHPEYCKELIERKKEFNK